MPTLYWGPWLAKIRRGGPVPSPSTALYVFNFAVKYVFSRGPVLSNNPFLALRSCLKKVMATLVMFRVFVAQFYVPFNLLSTMFLWVEKKSYFRKIIIHYFNAGGSTNFYETQIGSCLTENGWFWVKKKIKLKKRSFICRWFT